MTDTEGTENTELNAQSDSSDSDAELNTQSEGDDETTGGINIEDAERRASADYQERIKEFDSVDSTPVVSVPATGESGTVEMPKP
jgi:hypothetical protein